MSVIFKLDKIKPVVQAIKNTEINVHTTVLCDVGYFSTMKNEALTSSETLVAIYQKTRRHNKTEGSVAKRTCNCTWWKIAANFLTTQVTAYFESESGWGI